MPTGFVQGASHVYDDFFDSRMGDSRMLRLILLSPILLALWFGKLAERNSIARV